MIIIKPEKRNFPLIDTDKPNLLRDIFDYSNVPKIKFDGIIVPINLPDEIWITDTTFRDGQQARPPFSVQQVVDIFELMHSLSGPNGVIKQTEFFLYSNKDKEAVDQCRARNFAYPQITGWIRANKNDFKLVKEMKLTETGILTSVSDYHIFLKLGKTRKQILDDYLGIVKEALSNRIIPRCHFEDITRADIYEFVIPYTQQLMRLSEEAKIPIKIRLCDTMGYGISNPEAALPRGVPKLAHSMIYDGGVPSKYLEWHGHNDFHRAHTNSISAWLYGISAINGAFLSFGERTGNTPIEALIIEYIGLMGNNNGINTTVITDIANYFKEKLDFHIPDNTPFVGSKFNVTMAGIHADGNIKNEEIYNIFDTQKILAKAPGVIITDKSGIAGIAMWLNSYFNFTGDKKIDKHNPGVAKIYEWVMKQYDNGRTTSISDEELYHQSRKYLPQLFKSELDELKEKVRKYAQELIENVAAKKEIKTMDPKIQEPVLKKIIEESPFIQLIAVTNSEGKRVTKNITQITDRAKYENFTKGDFSDSEWFIKVMQDGKTHITGLYTSRITGALITTVSAPISNDKDNIIGILEFDIKFEDAVKL